MQHAVFIISGLTPKNLTLITDRLMAIEGAKPLVANQATGLYVFSVISISLSKAEIERLVYSTISGTGASVVT